MVVGGFLEKLSDETIVEIFTHLAPKGRARFSAINRRLHNLLHLWSDINRITAYKDGIVLASERCILEVEIVGKNNNEKDLRSGTHSLASSLRTAPFIQKLVISSMEHIRTIPATAFNHLSNIRELTIPCDIFNKETNLDDKIGAIFSIKKLLVLRILKRFDTPRKAINIVRVEHVKKLQASAIKLLKLQGVSLTAAAMETIAQKYSKSLKYLCLMGALVHTPDGPKIFKALCNLKCISKLTLPPSLFSLSSKPPYRECRLLRQLSAKCLCVYVCESEIVETRYFVKKLLPNTLEELCLHDPTHLVAKDLKSDEFCKLHFKITYCRRNDSLYQQEWMRGHCELLSHMVWMPPYKHFNTEYPHPVPGWWFFMSEDVNTAQENSEITASDSSLSDAQPQQPSIQLQLPPNEDPGEMMMATIARFFERMIDDQLNTEFGAGLYPEQAGTNDQIPRNHTASSNTSDSIPPPPSRNAGRTRRSLIIISRGGNRIRDPGQEISEVSAGQTRTPVPSTALPHTPSATRHQETPSATDSAAESPDSGESEDGDSNREASSDESDSSASSTTTTPQRTRGRGLNPTQHEP